MIITHFAVVISTFALILIQKNKNKKLSSYQFHLLASYILAKLDWCFISSIRTRMSLVSAAIKKLIAARLSSRQGGDIFFTPILTARYLIVTEETRRFTRGVSFRMTSLEEVAPRKKRTERRSGSVLGSHARSQGPRGPYAYAEPGPAYSDGEAHGERGVVPRHATRIRNEYKYIEGPARGTEKERHVR